MGEPEYVKKLAVAHSVIPPLSERIDSAVQCSFTLAPAIKGVCPVHDSDACLSRYVRYNFVFERMEHNIKEAFVRTRRDC